MFDEQPDGDVHGECAAEIHRLQALSDEALDLLDTLFDTFFDKNAIHHINDATFKRTADLLNIHRPVRLCSISHEKSTGDTK